MTKFSNWRIPYDNNKTNNRHMKKIIYSLLIFGANSIIAQTNPIITSWLQNTTGIVGRHYVSGNSTAITDAVEANVQTVQYSTDYVYVSTHGIPAYITGPFLDGNPSLATDQNGIFKFPLVPTQNTGVGTATSGGNIGLFINGVALFDYRDGVAWNPSTSALCGGPGNPPCPGGPMATNAWNRDAIPAEKAGFDCSKAHPAMGNYHHHQNPSAFNLDLNVISNICDLYPSDGLYTIDVNSHSPLIGFAADGFPIYGAYGFANTDGTGGIVRMQSSYSLRNITTRTTSPTGATVASGPDVNATYFLGYFREDYEYIANSGDLDDHNGRFCITPEYPNGTYAYFCTVDENHNSAYPYAVGPTYYGNVQAAKVTSITETVTTYTQASELDENLFSQVSVYPNPSNDFIAIQFKSLAKESISLELYDSKGNMVQKTSLNQGSTIAYFDIQKLYSGNYIVKIGEGKNQISQKISIIK
jgi:hypothetical protein